MIYISGIGCISPQNTLKTDDFLTSVVNHNALFLQSIQPESYREYIDPLLSRRLSRIVRMGIASAVISLREANVTMPGAIITGTANGCMTDTEKFLTTMLDNNETLLNPTNFMQSTYNTISSQIAIILKCSNYNSTYVHRGFSFESALIDAINLIQTGETDTALVGGIDEITENHFNITSLLGVWKKVPENHLEMLKKSDEATIPGEGSVFFTLTTEKKASTYAQLIELECLYKPKNPELLYRTLDNFLKRNMLTPESINLLVAGLNGKKSDDEIYHNLINHLFPNTPVIGFKHLCGEYPTASAFGLWLSANILKRQNIPQITFYKGIPKLPVRNILLYNHYNNDQHVFMLVRGVS